jgi:hypothetical protein
VLRAGAAKTIGHNYASRASPLQLGGRHEPSRPSDVLGQFQPEEEIGSSRAAEESCAAEILIFDWRLDNLWIVATGRENL